MRRWESPRSEGADDAERAGEEQDIYLAASIAAIRSKVAAGDSAHTCHDCAEAIEEDRRKAQPGCTRCAECETRLEKGSR
ncbi:MAG: TraR/DksA C4-type zinc finger protein [Desulfobacterales bacterium]|nr:TraR/DksA C4-type zinc finger protein [Desulfobacterales bacterium]